MKRKTWILIGLLVFTLVLGACGNGGGQSDGGAEGTLELKAGHVLTEDSPYHIALNQWAEEIYEQTEGRIKIDVFANSVLGNERDMVEALQMGTLDISMPNSAVLSNFTDAFKVFDLPFAFMDRDEVYKVIDSEIGDEMLAALGEVKLIGLAMWENGFRYVANNVKEVYTPDDLKGLKIRTMETPIHMASFNAWGADATAMAWGEVYTALQQKTIDGLENPFTPIYQNKLHEVAPYITMTGHFYCPAPLIISEKTWAKISSEDREIIIALSEKYKHVERALCEEADEIFMQTMIDEGASIVTAVDKDLWRNTAQSVYDHYAAEIGADYLKRIEEKIAE